MTDPVPVLIADDEPLLRFHLQKLLEDIWPEIDRFFTAANGTEAWQQIEQHRPSAVFLDIKMPGMSGIEVAARMQAAGITGECGLVFLTAYDEYAVNAFEREALDYVLKPVDEQRLEKTVARLQSRLSALESDAGADAGAPDLSALQQWLGQQTTPWLKWVNAQHGDDIHVLDVAQVLLFRAEDKYTTVVTADGEYLIRRTLKQLESELDPHRFWRVHRSVLVQVGAIERVKREQSGTMKVYLKNLKKAQPVSRRFADRFRQM